MNWRDTKRRARQQVHSTFRLPCWRVPASGDEPVAGWARLHVARPTASNEGLGDIESLGYARRTEIEPRLVFLIEDGLPARGDVIVFDEDEAYRLEASRPSDDITVTWMVTRLTKGQMDNLPALTFPVPEV